MKKLIKLCVVGFLFSSCASRSLDADDYVKYTESDKHHLVKHIAFGEQEYTFQLATPEYMVCKEIEDSDSASKLRAIRLNELKGIVFFLIKIASSEKSKIAKGGNRNAELQLNVDRMVAYYDQQAVVDFTLSINGKQLKPVIYHFENNYDLSPFNTIVVGFDIGLLDRDMTLSFNDRFNNAMGLNTFFSQQDLQQIPQLKPIN